MCNVPVQQNVYVVLLHTEKSLQLNGFRQIILQSISHPSWIICLTPPSKHNPWLTPLIIRLHISHPHYAITASRPHDISVSHWPLGLAFTLPSAISRSCPCCPVRAITDSVLSQRTHTLCLRWVCWCLSAFTSTVFSPWPFSFTCWSAPPCCSPSPCCPAFRPQWPPARLQLHCPWHRPWRGSLRHSPWWRTREGQLPVNLRLYHSCWARWPRCRRSWGCCWWCSYLCCCHRHCPRHPPQRPGSQRQRPAEVSGTSLRTPPGSASDPAQSGEKTSFSRTICLCQQQYSSTTLNNHLVKLEQSLF